MKEVVIFTHHDLDGIFASFLLEQYFQRTDSAIRCQIKSGSAGMQSSECINYKLNRQKLWYYDQIILTDFVPTVNNCQKLIDWQETHQKNVIIFDHHLQSNELAKRFPQLHFILSPKDNEFVSASLLVLYWLKQKDITIYQEYYDLAHCVNAYDTYAFSLLPSKPYHDVAIKWNMLFYHLGPNKFIKRVSENSDPYYFTTNEKQFFDKQYEIINANLELISIQKEQYQIPLKNNQTATIWLTTYLPQYASEISNLILTEYPELDIIILSNNEQAIFRTRKDNFDMNQLAQIFHGGGHQKAAGAKTGWLAIHQYLTSQVGSKV